MKNYTNLWVLLWVVYCSLFSQTILGQVNIDKSIQMSGGTNAEKRITGVGNPGSADHAVNAGNIQSGALIYANATLSGSIYTVTLSPVPAGYTGGMVVNFKSNLINTSPVSIDVNGLGAKPIKKNVATDLAVGDIAAGQLASVIYDGTNFQLLTGLQGPQGPQGTAGTNGANGILPDGSAAGNTPYWNGSSWIVNNGNIYNNGGNVGIGGIVPAQQFEVSKGGNWQFSLRNPDVGGGFWNIGVADNNFASGGGKLLFVPNSTTSTAATVTFLNTGNVGIGTTGPNVKLEVAGEINASGDINSAWGDFTHYVQFPNANTTTPTYFMGFSVTTSTRRLYLDNQNQDTSPTDPAGSITLRTGNPVTDRLNVSYSGKVKINDLASSGNSVVMANSGGTLYKGASGVRTTFIHWGRNDCPATSTLVYAGYAASGHYNQSGSGANTLCLTNTPDWTGASFSLANDPGAVIYGLEFETSGLGVSTLASVNNYDASCAVCIVEDASVTIMVPGATICPASQGWTRQYWGYLMATRSNMTKSEFVCVVNDPMQTGLNANDDGALWYPVEGRSGSLAMPPYVNLKELTCVVCTK